jgi:hypothetical protein
MDLYTHSAIRLHGVMLNKLRTRTTLPLRRNFTTWCVSNRNLYSPEPLRWRLVAGYLKFSSPPSRNLPAAGTSCYCKKESGGEIASPRAQTTYPEVVISRRVLITLGRHSTCTYPICQVDVAFRYRHNLFRIRSQSKSSYERGLSNFSWKNTAWNFRESGNIEVLYGYEIWFLSSF